jgi:glycosyltransferase involved in cell wall biosynthesis
MNNSLITIITVVLNGEKFLEKTIKSVLNQNYTNLEYIIIDGGSTDNTTKMVI